MKRTFTTLAIILLTSTASFATDQEKNDHRIIAAFTDKTKSKDTVVVKKERSFKEMMITILMKFEK